MTINRTERREVLLKRPQWFGMSALWMLLLLEGSSEGSYVLVNLVGASLVFTFCFERITSYCRLEQLSDHQLR